MVGVGHGQEGENDGSGAHDSGKDEKLVRLKYEKGDIEMIAQA